MAFKGVRSRLFTLSEAFAKRVMLGLTLVTSTLYGDVAELDVFVIAIFCVEDPLEVGWADVTLIKVAEVFAAEAHAGRLIHGTRAVISARSDDHACLFFGEAYIPHLFS